MELNEDSLKAQAPSYKMSTRDKMYMIKAVNVAVCYMQKVLRE